MIVLNKEKIESSVIYIQFDVYLDKVDEFNSLVFLIFLNFLR